MNMRISMDEILCNMRKESTVELAAMLKEVGKGTMKDLKKILAKFCLQEGRTKRKAKEYFDNLEAAGLVIFKNGNKKWEYNKDAEWELFNVQI